MHAVGLYVHIPFCRKKCAYCDFNSYAGKEALYGPYLKALYQEMSWARSSVSGAGARVRTLYVGGGTPTVLPGDDLAALVRAVRVAFALDADAEITVEANPGTVTEATLRTLRAAGVNRLSRREGCEECHDTDDGMQRPRHPVGAAAWPSTSSETHAPPGIHDLPPALWCNRMALQPDFRHRHDHDASFEHNSGNKADPA